MSDDRFIVRRPRHEVVDKADCHITIEWTGSSEPLDAALADVSRFGLKVILDRDMPPDTRLRLSLEQTANDFHVVLPVTVRWSHIEDNGRWGIGCIFDREMSWELMGELFLHGILCVDTVASGVTVPRP